MSYGYLALAVLVMLFACAVLAMRWQTNRTSHVRSTSGERSQEARAATEIQGRSINGGSGGGLV